MYLLDFVHHIVFEKYREVTFDMKNGYVCVSGIKVWKHLFIWAF
jgi:hypothetical protein